MTIQQIVLASRPKGTPTLNNFRFENVELNALHDDEISVEGSLHSVDPYMRSRMNHRELGIDEFVNKKLIRINELSDPSK